MAGSILDDVKKMLGLGQDYTAFDLDVMTHVNSILAVLNGLGIGPVAGFMIVDNTSTWETYLGPDAVLPNDPKFNLVKSYMFLRVRMLFDPPATSMAIDAMTKMYEEFEWRLNTEREGDSWTDPNPPAPPPSTEPPWWEVF